MNTDAELFRRVEALADSFDPAAVEEYVALFSRVIARRLGRYDAAELQARYRRIRQPKIFQGDPARVRTVFVLSRVTLGADIAVTSLVLDAMLRRFPSSRVVLAGGRKNRDLFAADPRVHWLPVEYGRTAALPERLAAGLQLARSLDAPDSIVVDPDSRLTQLGLLPVCDERNYYFFESRSWGGDSRDAISELTSQWLAATFGVPDARPWIAPAAQPDDFGGITVNLGVGENPAKRVPDPFEERLLAGLAGFGLPLLVDTGAGGDEQQRVEDALSRVHLDPCRVRTFHGPFADIAARIATSRLYVGYDSAGQHAAAACGVPLVTVFAGFPCERFYWRWQPTGPGPKITVRVDPPPDPERILAQTLAAARSLLGAPSQR